MCGIVGYVGRSNNCISTLLTGLKKLEYRGYDSAGIAYVRDKNIVIKKEKGSLDNLINLISNDVKSSIGIGHTRWATHGKADKTNAHPHQVGHFTIVHNGIIENYLELGNKLREDGYKFVSETDTEILCAMLDSIYQNEKDILKSIKSLNKVLDGSYAVVIICDDDLDNLYVIKKNSPLIIGIGEDGNYIASDVPAILDKTNKYISLNDGDYAKIGVSDIELYNNGKKIPFEIKEFEYSALMIDKQGYEHYMLKEIHDEPIVFKKTTEIYLHDGIKSLLEKMPDFTKYSKIRIVACGSATFAGYVGKQMLEQYANIKTEVDTASEFRYNKIFLDKDELVIVISQSGETADTLEALKIANNHGIDTLGIINEKGSSMARIAKMVLYTEAGKEIAVATTKAYFSQVTMLSLMALNIAYSKKLITDNELEEILKDTKTLPNYIQNMIDKKDLYKNLAEELKDYNDVFYLGRGIDYALAMEGSLKLKEISYVHSEAYASGELKHGTISLIEEGTPVVAMVTVDDLALKEISNIKEVKSRGAKVILITNRDNEDDAKISDTIIKIPKVCKAFSPLLAVIPLQMIAYELAKLKECSIDKPRNLAKSVTVE